MFNPLKRVVAKLAGGLAFLANSVRRISGCFTTSDNSLGAACNRPRGPPCSLGNNSTSATNPSGVRAGLPTRVEGLSLVCCTVVVALQVVGAAMRWSIDRPFAVDLRSARATPAPPVTMAAYSARLALVTTVTGLVFTGLARLDQVAPVLLVTLVMLLWSAWRLERTAQRWDDPVVRARVVSVVAG